MFYRFRLDDDTFACNNRIQRETTRNAVLIHGWATLTHAVIQDRDYGIKTYSSCFVASHMLTWLVRVNKCPDR